MASVDAVMENEGEKRCNLCFEFVCYLKGLAGKLPCGDIYCKECYENDYNFTDKKKKQVNCYACR